MKKILLVVLWVATAAVALWWYAATDSSLWALWTVGGLLPAITLTIFASLQATKDSKAIKVLFYILLCYLGVSSFITLMLIRETPGLPWLGQLVWLAIVITAFFLLPHMHSPSSVKRSRASAYAPQELTPEELAQQEAEHLGAIYYGQRNPDASGWYEIKDKGGESRSLRWYDADSEKKRWREYHPNPDFTFSHFVSLSQHVNDDPPARVLKEQSTQAWQQKELELLRAREARLRAERH